jgi:hypothetical protein
MVPGTARAEPYFLTVVAVPTMPFSKLSRVLDGGATHRSSAPAWQRLGGMEGQLRSRSVWDLSS